MKNSVIVRDLCAKDVGLAIGDAPGTRTSRQVCTLGVKTRSLWAFSDVHQRQAAAKHRGLWAQALLSHWYQIIAEYSQRYRCH